MLYALNNQKLLVRDIENFSKENFNADNNTGNRIVAIETYCEDCSKIRSSEYAIK